MRINPPKFNFREYDYKKKSTPEQVLAALRSRYMYQTIKRNQFKLWLHRKSPSKHMKIHIGPMVPYIPHYQWDKLKYRFGKMTK